MNQFAKWTSVFCVVLASLPFSEGVRAETPTLRMWLKNGSFIDGKLAASPRESHLRIDSDLFTRPVDFDVRAIRSVAGDYSPNEPKDGHAFLLANGTRVSGQLMHWSDTHVIVKTQSIGEITLDRKLLRAVESLRDSGKTTVLRPQVN